MSSLLQCLVHTVLSAQSDTDWQIHKGVNQTMSIFQILPHHISQFLMLTVCIPIWAMLHKSKILHTRLVPLTVFRASCSLVAKVILLSSTRKGLSSHHVTFLLSFTISHSLNQGIRAWSKGHYSQLESSKLFSWALDQAIYWTAQVWARHCSSIPCKHPNVSVQMHSVITWVTHLLSRVS